MRQMVILQLPAREDGGRTSMLPVRVAGIRDATWMASFKSRASMR
jgi:hypothetical protein